ncbi:MAG: S41 family peptidase [Planctomycetota bacterium]
MSVTDLRAVAELFLPRLAVTAAIAVAASGVASAATADAPAASFTQHHALSPDGSTLVFSRAGDLWSAPASGGPAVRLTAHPALETRSAFSPDGSKLAFASNRDGATNLYIMDIVTHAPGVLTAGQPERVTVSDSGQNLSGWTADGAALLFDSYAERDIYRHPRAYAAPIDGGPVTRLTEAYAHTARHAPDGSAVVFTRGWAPLVRPIYRGPAQRDLFLRTTASRSGEERFTQLTEHDANEDAAFITPDGSVVFVSSRDGQNNLYRLRAGATDTSATPEQLTVFEPSETASIGHGVRDLAVSADGTTAAFAVWDTVYTLDLTSGGSSPAPIAIEASLDDDTADERRIDLSSQVGEARLSPDGKTVAMIARGDVIIRSTERDRPGRRVTATHAREQGLAWSPDGTYLYFSSNADGVADIHRASVAIARGDLMPEDAESVPNEVEPDDAVDAADDADAGTGGDEADAAEDAAADDDTSKDDAPSPGDRWSEALTFTVEPIVSNTEPARDPVVSPDGTKLIYRSGLATLVLHDLATGRDRVLFSDWNVDDVQWAADSTHIVFSWDDLDFNSDIYLLNTADDNAEPVNITRHPDNDFSPRLSRDGKVLYFLSERAGVNWSFDVFRVFLDEKLDRHTEYELAEYFEDAASEAAKAKPIDPPAPGDGGSDSGESSADDADSDEAAPNAAAVDADPEPFTFDAEDAYLRVTRLTTNPASESSLVITPAGDRVLFSTSIDGDRKFVSTDYNGEERETVQTGSVSSVAVSLDGKRVAYVKGGKAHATPVKGGKTETFGFRANAEVVVAEEQRQKFREGASEFGRTFYHPTMKGLDWNALLDRYEALAASTRTNQAFNRVVTMLFGEVDGSHTGIRGGDAFDAPSPRVGSLGVLVSPATNGYRVERVLQNGPSDRDDETSLTAGDLITAIDESPLASNAAAAGVIDFDAAMMGTAGAEVLVAYERDGEERLTLVEAISSGAGRNLLYQTEVERRRAEVDRLSDGRIGYLHIRAMSGPSVRDFERDLFAAASGKDALVIDVRDNGGGSTTDILLASLTAPRHAYTVPRGSQHDINADNWHYPRDRRLIHPYQNPLAVLCNQNSFSNAEIFSHAIKNTGRGVLVGEQTFGGVISTGGFSLIDGTFIRRPFRGWYLPDGTDMENNGAIPDIRVEQTPEDEAASVDAQLEAAVESLLETIQNTGRAAHDQR